MKKLILILFALLAAREIRAFGLAGHAAIACIAEHHLTPRAKANIMRYTDHHSIVYYASWMDEWRHSKGYEFTTHWHAGTVDAQLRSTAAVRDASGAKGDCVEAVEQSMALLSEYEKLDDSTVLVHIKYLVHLLGDMHCPTHVKYPDVKGFNIYVDGRKLNYHGVWDGYVLDCNVRWNSMEFQHVLDRCTKKEIKAITAGSVRDWFHDCAVYCRQIYVLAQPEQQFKSPDVWEDFLNPALPIAERQILYAGYRLAHVLNELFG